MRDGDRGWPSADRGVTDVGYLDVPTGHRARFTKPVELRRALVAALEG
ncbi:hypothetical protein ACFSEO_09450 [Agromyces cerinus subsp. nitratus]